MPSRVSASDVRRGAETPNRIGVPSRRHTFLGGKMAKRHSFIAVAVLVMTCTALIVPAVAQTVQPAIVNADGVGKPPKGAGMGTKAALENPKCNADAIEGWGVFPLVTSTERPVLRGAGSGRQRRRDVARRDGHHDQGRRRGAERPAVLRTRRGRQPGADQPGHRADGQFRSRTWSPTSGRRSPTCTRHGGARSSSRSSRRAVTTKPRSAPTR